MYDRDVEQVTQEQLKQYEDDINQELIELKIANHLENFIFFSRKLPR